jgi:hypothetical protein
VSLGFFKQGEQHMQRALKPWHGKVEQIEDHDGASLPQRGGMRPIGVVTVTRPEGFNQKRNLMPSGGLRLYGRLLCWDIGPFIPEGATWRLAFHPSSQPWP